jgi:diaminohydroxyphosphoribosylaminopyrimidine deaminase/5-amino-6-(5-phosphoribosylamino)uracil reductase
MAEDAGDRPLLRALEVARQGWGATHPNPMVGAVITEGGSVVAEGFHARAGEPHAEIMALRALGRRPGAEAVLHVTLEPCSTQGRTPPCVQAILDTGIRHVVVGTVDPNPLHAGRGLELLRAAGVEVRLAAGPVERACRQLNFLFNHWITRRRTLVALKVARDATGRTVPRAGERWITGEAARADVMRWRRLFPAIAVGAGTALADNPRLTARLPSGEWCPIRLLLDRSGRTAGQSQLHLFSDAHRAQTVVALDPRRVSPERLAWFRALGVRLWEVASDNFLNAIVDRATADGWLGLMVEPGPVLGQALLSAGLVDHGLVYTAPAGRADATSPGWLAGNPPLLDPERVELGADTLLAGSWLNR